VPIWQVSWFSPGHPEKELLQVYTWNDQTRRVTQVWTGFQVAWSMARRLSGCGVGGSRTRCSWLPVRLSCLFLTPGVQAGRRCCTSTLMMLRRFSNLAGLLQPWGDRRSRPLVYPFLVYLFLRMLRSVGKGVPRRPLSTIVSSQCCCAESCSCSGCAIGLNILNSNVIECRLRGSHRSRQADHGHLLYGCGPRQRLRDTYDRSITSPMSRFA